VAHQQGQPIDGKYIIGDDNPLHYRNARHYHVHDLHSEKRACNIQQIIDAGHVRTFTPDSVATARAYGYVLCEHCLGGPHCGS
jgi:hypothetical protein